MSLRPLTKAYALGYLTAITPRLGAFLGTLRRKDLSPEAKLKILYNILKTSTQINRFPTSCAIIVGGVTALPRLIQSITKWILRLLGKSNRFVTNPTTFARLRIICSFLSAWVAFDLLNRDESWARKRAQSQRLAQINALKLENPNQHHSPTNPPRYAGKTIDLTIFAAVRALDVAVITAWATTRSKSLHTKQVPSRVVRFIQKTADPWIFATSAAIIMWSWFYSPHRLPRGYRDWISAAAQIDSRLIEALRLARQGDYVYGQDTGHSQLLTGLCRDLNLPEDYADPVKTIPIPCELYHTGTGKNCEIHAISRFWRSWTFAMKIYLPLQLLTKIRSLNSETVISALKSAARSSSFLAAFISIFYYAVCLSRTRLGPKIFSYQTITPQMWDSGLCVLAGCLACGWSIMLEKPSRRQEIAFFVSPRALATLFPRVYDKQYLRREQLIFASSIALVMSAATSNNPGRIRGVLGKILQAVLRE